MVSEEADPALYVEPRKRLTKKQRAFIFERDGGICCLCGIKILAGEKWIDEHVKPLWLAMPNAEESLNDLSNRKPAHVDCAQSKTSLEASRRAKVRRIAEKLRGKKSKTPLPCGRDSAWKKKFGGKVVRRTK